MTLTMSGLGKNGGIMYDCIKLETGNAVTDAIHYNVTANDYPIAVYGVNGKLVGVYRDNAIMNLPHGIYICRKGTDCWKIAK